MFIRRNIANDHVLDEDREFPAIGGPWHGRLFSGKGETLGVADPFPEISGDPTGRGADRVAIGSLRRDYTLKHFTIDYGSMMLTGTAWVWNRLEATEVVSVAIGMLLGAALKRDVVDKAEHPKG